MTDWVEVLKVHCEASSQQKVAEILGVSRQTISLALSGKQSGERKLRAAVVSVLSAEEIVPGRKEQINVFLIDHLFVNPGCTAKNLFEAMEQLGFPRKLVRRKLRYLVGVGAVGVFKLEEGCFYKLTCDCSSPGMEECEGCPGGRIVRDYDKRFCLVGGEDD